MTHEHHWIVMEKCSTLGCGSYCECGAFKEITTGIVFNSKADASKYFRFDNWTKTEDMPQWLIDASLTGYCEAYIINVTFKNTSYVSIGRFKNGTWHWYETDRELDPVHTVTHFRSLPEGPDK